MNNLKQKISASFNSDKAGQNFKPLVIFGVIGLVFFLGCLFWTSHTRGHNEQILASQKAQIEALENKISVKQAANNRKIKKANQAITGLNYVRKDKDDAIVTKFFQKCTTWNNAQQYRRLREEIMQKYGISEKSSFMTNFMPKLPQENMGIGNNGHNEVDDDNLNLSFDSIHTYVTDIAGSNYSYFGIVTVNSHDKKGATATGTIAVRYTVNGRGKITNLSASNVGYNGDDNND